MYRYGLSCQPMLDRGARREDDGGMEDIDTYLVPPIEEDDGDDYTAYLDSLEELQA